MVTIPKQKNEENAEEISYEIESDEVKNSPENV